MSSRFLIRRALVVLLAANFLFVLSADFCFAQDEDGDPIAIFNQGQEAHEKGDLETALRFYDEALKLAPEFPEAEYQRATIFLSLNKNAEAEKSLRRALELRADWSLPMTALGVLLVRQNNFTEAETFLEKSVAADAQNFSAYSALTDLRLKTNAGREVLQKLLSEVRNLTAKANSTAAIWVSRALLENALGDKTSAKASLNQALAINPKDKSALVEKAEISVSEGDLTAASDIVKTLSQIAPAATETKILQARTFAASGKTGEAVKILDTIENPSPDVSNLRAAILSNGAVNVAELEKQLETNAKSPAILGRLCALLRTENPAKALEYCRRAAEIEPDNLNHASGYAAALVQSKQYATAITILNRILQIAPDNFTARANLAIALFQSQRFNEAKKEYLRLAEIQPDLAIAYYFLGIIHDNLKEYMDAMASYQLFLRHANAAESKLEIEKVNLRLPVLQKLIRENKGKKQ